MKQIIILLISFLCILQLGYTHQNIQKAMIANQIQKTNKKLELAQIENKGVICQRDIDNFMYEPKSYFYVVEHEEEQNPQYSDIYGRFQINWDDQSQYHRSVDYLGGGTFSSVYKGTLADTDTPIVLKYYNDQKWDYVAKIEVKIQQTLDGGPYIQHYLGSFKTNDTNLPFCLVYNYVSSTILTDINNDLTNDEIQTYMYQLLQALDYAHSKGIIHLDLKPDNLVIDQEKQQIQLIDWGISEFLVSDKEQVRRGTYEFSAPEALVQYKCCDFTLDSWSAGTLLAVMMFKRTIVFDQTSGSGDQAEVFANIANLYSVDVVDQTLSKLNIQMTDDFMNEYQQYRDINSNSTFESVFINDNNRQFVTDDGLDLMKQLLTFDFTQRISPKQALEHRYFDSIRVQIE